MIPPNPSMTLMLLTLAHLAIHRQSDHNHYVRQPVPINQSEFDYIIVGAGTTGCILAYRLSQQSENVSILLLEAGGPQSVITDMIGNTQYLIGGEFDWNYHVQPQSSAGLAYPEFSISRGKVLGGTSTTQWGIYNRGNPRDYNNWSERYGLQNMSWSQLEPYFLMFENNQGLIDRFHRSDGLVAITNETKPDPILMQFLRLMNSLGYPTIDINGETQDGTTIAQMFYDANTGLKSTTANSYIEFSNKTKPNHNHHKIRIVSRAMVRRILLDQQDSTRARGVVFQKNGTQYHMYARREVILAAGPINTPQILMLSGIGPEDHLEELNIPVVRNLSVGDNLQDMVFVPLYYRIENYSMINPYPRFDSYNLYEYFYNHDGPLAHHADGITYYSSTQNSAGREWPDTMIITVVEFFNDLNGTVSQYVNLTDRWRQYWTPYANDGYYLAIDPVLARPRSRGTVRLNPNDIHGPPLIDPRYLNDERDFQAMLDVTMFAVNAVRRNPLDGLTMFPPIPGCPIPCMTDSLCETYLRCHIRSLARSYYNFAGTARMGLHQTDPNAVVDPRFKVVGFENLRVIDASVVPEMPNGHITAATIMLGELGAATIIEDNLNP